MRRLIAPALVLLIAAAGAAGTKIIRGSRTASPQHFGLGAHPKPIPQAPQHPTAQRRPRTVACGPGRDIVNADAQDRVGHACEVVSVRVSHDGLIDPEAQHQTEVEPDSAAWGSTIVATFQVGRFTGGGALATGYATSRDAGTTWRPGILPALSTHSRPAGPFEVVSDPSVAYDAAHGVWLISSLVAPERGAAIAISRSNDGVTWNAPVIAAPAGGDYDKEWVACDNGHRSPYRGRCYLAYINFTAGALELRRSNDGGKTWSGPSFPVRRLPAASSLNGAQPLVRPDGSLLVLYTEFNGFLVGVNDVGVARSTNGGVSFAEAVSITPLLSQGLDGVRAPPFVSAAVDGSGVVYAAWADCRFEEDCGTNGIAWARSRNGVTWSAPARVATGDTRLSVDHFVPGLDVTGSGAKTRIAVAYYSRPQPIGCGYTCSVRVDVWLSESHTAGATWLKPQRLNTATMRGGWIADSDIGKFVGDYISTSYVRGKPMPVFALATRPVGGRLRQAIYVGTRIVR